MLLFKNIYYISFDSWKFPKELTLTLQTWRTFQIIFDFKSYYSQIFFIKLSQYLKESLFLVVIKILFGEKLYVIQSKICKIFSRFTTKLNFYLIILLNWNHFQNPLAFDWIKVMTVFCFAWNIVIEVIVKFKH